MYETSNALDSILGGQLDPKELTKLEVIPSIIDSNNRPIPEFVEFKKNVSQAILKQDWVSLYLLSDTSMEPYYFDKLIQKTWRKFWDTFNEYKKESKNLAVTLNIDRFKEPHKEILGSFTIASYILLSSRDSISDSGYELAKFSTDLYFTYKNKKFVIVSAFTPFVQHKH